MTVRVMMFVKGDPEPGAVPSEELLEEMGRFNDELTDAGVLLDLAGLHPSAEGVRVRFSGGQPTVVNGPFPETKEVVAGYWVLQVKSMEEAVEWATRVPVHVPTEYGGEGEVEVRQIFEPEEFRQSPAIAPPPEFGERATGPGVGGSRPPTANPTLDTFGVEGIGSGPSRLVSEHGDD